MVLLQQAIGSREVGRSHVNSESSRDPESSQSAALDALRRSHMVVRFLVGRLRLKRS